MNEETALQQVKVEHDWIGLMSMYRTPASIRGWNIKPSVNQAHDAGTAAKILRKVLADVQPGLTQAEHIAIALVHEDMAARCLDAWSTIVNCASKETFGRDYEFADYNISGIACDAYREERKEQLRTLSHAATKHANAARAHARLGNGRYRLH